MKGEIPDFLDIFGTKLTHNGQRGFNGNFLVNYDLKIINPVVKQG